MFFCRVLTHPSSFAKAVAAEGCYPVHSAAFSSLNHSLLLTRLTTSQPSRLPPVMSRNFHSMAFWLHHRICYASLLARCDPLPGGRRGDESRKRVSSSPVALLWLISDSEGHVWVSGRFKFLSAQATPDSQAQETQPPLFACLIRR
eukprot:3082663-Rhodomonas_salina.2